MLYNTASDVDQRLVGTIVEYDKASYKVVGTSKPRGSKTYSLELLSHVSRVAYVNLDDPKLNYMSLRLGYGNRTDKPHWPQVFRVSRMPCRAPYRQGLCRDNVVFDDPHNISWETIWRNGLLDQIFSEDYPTLERAREILTEETTSDMADVSVAISRDFAIYRDEIGLLKVYYRGIPVAWGSWDDLKVLDEHQYLTNILKAKGFNVSC